MLRRLPRPDLFQKQLAVSQVALAHVGADRFLEFLQFFVVFALNCDLVEKIVKVVGHEKIEPGRVGLQAQVVGCFSFSGEPTAIEIKIRSGATRQP